MIAGVIKLWHQSTTMVDTAVCAKSFLFQLVPTRWAMLKVLLWAPDCYLVLNFADELLLLAAPTPALASRRAGCSRIWYQANWRARREGEALQGVSPSRNLPAGPPGRSRRQARISSTIERLIKRSQLWRKMEAVASSKAATSTRTP